MFSIPPARVQYWVAEKLLLTKGGRITESSFSKFLADHPTKLPFETLRPDMQNWLREMGYPGEEDNANAVSVGSANNDYACRPVQYASAAESQSSNEG